MKPTKTHDWIPRKRSRVLDLDGGKHSIPQIAQLTGLPKSTVSDIKKQTTSNSKPKSGRPKVLSDRDKHRINIYIKKTKETRQASPEAIIKTLELSCSIPTLVKAIHKLDYRRWVARRRCLLKEIDYKRRLAYTQALDGRRLISCYFYG